MKKVIFLASVLIVLIILLGLILKRSNTHIALKIIPTLTPVNNDMKTFISSSSMDFTILVPDNYDVIEKMGSVIISSSSGNIY
ncbi:MAG: hypothetical protein UT39_C0012G0062 [Candidatus Woesebacteria bacterium GW2011_GWA1_39_21]|uniref:Uncharacterized protein n=1 Tax=Candidatus Woesebacteria bacterium GW2011_GWA1_39_21 TaxID=1618550 RepID=A0A0G0QKW3_9BACT|nr:MAG: hypothetical protein UT39_C0012G0062 [Candidatus Woesebacteria bacterium GW2011_GWA1_39_21]